jgi:hypothetical protein
MSLRGALTRAPLLNDVREEGYCHEDDLAQRTQLPFATGCGGCRGARSTGRRLTGSWGSSAACTTAGLAGV